MKKNRNDFVVRGFVVDEGVDPVKFYEARKDIWFQAMLI